MFLNIISDQHFYVHFNDGFNQDNEHIDFTITTSHAAKPYKFGKYKFTYRQSGKSSDSVENFDHNIW